MHIDSKLEEFKMAKEKLMIRVVEWSQKNARRVESLRKKDIIEAIRKYQR